MKLIDVIKLKKLLKDCPSQVKRFMDAIRTKMLLFDCVFGKIPALFDLIPPAVSKIQEVIMIRNNLAKIIE
jgi:hypothetical protein